MGYRLTPEELEEFQGMVRGGAFVGESVTVNFTTTKDFLAEVLPPCFDVPDEPTAVVAVGRSQHGDDLVFESSTIAVAAQFRDMLGVYDLTHVHTGDMGITFGRELWGESKKQGEISLDWAPPRLELATTRHGVTLAAGSAEFGDDLGPRVVEQTQFHLKAFPNTRLTGLEWDPIVFAMHATMHYESYYEGTGALTLGGSAADPCDTIPVVSVDGWSYGRPTSHFSHDKYPVPGGDSYLSYVLGRSYDFAG